MQNLKPKSSALQWEKGEKPPFTLCESVWSTGRGSWHIRKTTDAGPKFGGGIDTGSLCERVLAGHGWDLEARLTPHHLDNNTCQTCLKLYLELNPSKQPGA